MAPVLSYDKVNQIITVPLTYVTPTEITTQDLLNDIRDYEDQLSSMEVTQIAFASGKDELGGGVLVGITLRLLDWKLQFAARGGPSWILCSVTGGNLVAVDDVGDSINPIEPSAYVTVVITNSSSATLQEQESIQYASFDGCVSIDVVNGTSGTAYPQGTAENPVDNLADAKTIAADRGFSCLRIYGNITFVSGQNLSGYVVEALNPGFSTITINSGTITYGTGFRNCTLEGVLNGLGWIEDCYIGLNGISNSQMSMRGCLFKGDIAFTGSDTIHLIDCFSAIAGNLTPEIDMGGDGPGLGLRAYTGGVLLKNKTGTSSVSLDYISGQAIIDSTVTNGTIVVRGTAKVTDNSTGATVVDITNVVNPSSVTDAVWDEDIADHLGVGSTGEALDNTSAAPTVDEIGEAVWAELVADNVVTGSFGEAVKEIYQVNLGRWKFDNTTKTLTIYDTDNSTPMAVFDMKDINGSPTLTDIYERVRQ